MIDIPDTDFIESISRTVHEAIRAWAMAHGQTDIPAWDVAEPWMQTSTRQSVQDVLHDKNMSGQTQHEHWVEQKMKDGWRYGPVKDPDQRTHPLLVPYEDLPDYERRKDQLVVAIVKALAH